MMKRRQWTPALMVLSTTCLLHACDADSKGSKTHKRLLALEAQLARVSSELQAQKTALQTCEALKEGELQQLRSTVEARSAVDDLLQYLRVEGNTLILEGVNLNIRNGSGSTDSVDGTGNLIIGYNELPELESPLRSGSHNVIVGSKHEYTSYSAYVGGTHNTSTAPFASVLAGAANVVSSTGAVSISGVNNEVSGWNAGAITGQNNTVSGGSSVVGTGMDNVVSGDFAVLINDDRQVVEHDGDVHVGGLDRPSTEGAD